MRQYLTTEHFVLLKVCTICIAYPWGDKNQKSSHLIDHLKLRHNFDYDRFVVSRFHNFISDNLLPIVKPKYYFVVVLAQPWISTEETAVLFSLSNNWIYASRSAIFLEVVKLSATLFDCIMVWYVIVAQLFGALPSIFFQNASFPFFWQKSTLQLTLKHGCSAILTLKL